jgi:hypothetical protein
LYEGFAGYCGNVELMVDVVSRKYRFGDVPDTIFRNPITPP